MAGPVYRRNCLYRDYHSLEISHDSLDEVKNWKLAFIEAGVSDHIEVRNARTQVLPLSSQLGSLGLAVSKAKPTPSPSTSHFNIASGAGVGAVLMGGRSMSESRIDAVDGPLPSFVHTKWVSTTTGVPFDSSLPSSSRQTLSSTPDTTFLRPTAAWMEVEAPISGKFATLSKKVTEDRMDTNDNIPQKMPLLS